MLESHPEFHRQKVTVGPQPQTMQSPPPQPLRSKRGPQPEQLAVSEQMDLTGKRKPQEAAPILATAGHTMAVQPTPILTGNILMCTVNALHSKPAAAACRQHVPPLAMSPPAREPTANPEPAEELGYEEPRS